MLTVTSCPSPVRSRWSRPARAPSNAPYPVIASTAYVPAGAGGSEARPTLSIAPLIAWSSMSWPGRFTYGPLSPYPEIDTYTMSGRTARMDS